MSFVEFYIFKLILRIIDDINFVETRHALSNFVKKLHKKTQRLQPLGFQERMSCSIILILSRIIFLCLIINILDNVKNMSINIKNISIFFIKKYRKSNRKNIRKI